MTPDLPPLPATDWLLHMPAAPYEPAWTSSQSGWDEEAMRAYAAEAVRVEHARLLDALEAAQKDAARLRKLVPIAAAQIGHRYEGDCPDELDRSRRDQGCPACALLLLAERESP